MVSPARSTTSSASRMGLTNAWITEFLERLPAPSGDRERPFSGRGVRPCPVQTLPRGHETGASLISVPQSPRSGAAGPG